MPNTNPSEIDEVLENLAKSHGDSKVISETRKSKDGDVLLIDFLGRVDGVEFAGGKAENYELTLGSGSFIPGFEEQLIGLNAGDKAEVKVAFPDNYGAAELAGSAGEPRQPYQPDRPDRQGRDRAEGRQAGDRIPRGDSALGGPEPGGPGV